MHRVRILGLLALPLAALCSLAACGGDDDDDVPNNPPPGSSGTGGSPGTGGTGGTGGAGGGSAGTGGGSQGAGGRPNAPGTFDVTVSGEDLGLTGYTFDPATAASNGDPPSFVDGWTIEFDHILLTLGNIRLNQGPDTNPDQPAEVGAEITKAPDSFAVDLARGGPETDKGSGQPGAWYLTTLRGNFDPQTRYAFSYSTVTASASATKVGFDQASEALYQQAIQNGWAMVFQGRATFVGKPTPPLATPFDAFSKVVNFTIGLANPASYVNCENPDLGGGEPPRGVQTLAGQASVVQITLHTDHLFWDALNVEGTPLHFDHIAAQAVFDAQNPAAPGTVTMAQLDGVPIAPVTVGATGPILPARSYVDDYAAQASLNLNPSSVGITQLGAFLRYTASSGGHMNADGECEVVQPLSAP